MLRIEAYLPGRGPIVEFRPESGTWYDGVVVSIDPDGTVTERFHWSGYQPGASTDTERGCANDIVAYAIAYVEDPDTFERSHDDTEQRHADWWLRHGDVLACETGDSTCD